MSLNSSYIYIFTETKTKIMKQKLLNALVLLLFQAGIGQNVIGKIMDSRTGESIPYANIMVNNTESLISNEEGTFTLSESKAGDDSILVISYLGYVARKMSVAELKSHQNTIKLEQGMVELADVNVSNVRPDANSIMAAVKKNLALNYAGNDQPVKDMLFLREVNMFRPKQFDFEIEKSTGFDKKTLKSANAQITAFTDKLVSQPSPEYTDMLFNYYSQKVVTKDKPASSLSKLEALKAIRLKDENRAVSIDEMQEAAFKILLQHVDSTKYYRFKSGWFGSKDTISLRKDFNSKKKKKNTALTASKTKLTMFLSENNVRQSTKLDFVNQTDIYEYTYEGAVYSSQNEFAYVITFKPRRSRANYTGKLYISETDFAVIKAEYALADGKTGGGMNMKWILGVKTSENVSKGTLIYKPNPIGTGYYLHYASVETGQYFYVSRPIKFIELSEEEKDVVAFDLKVEGNTRRKLELLNISKSEISETAFKEVDEKDFTYVKQKKYDPKVWQDYSTIEPLAEMKQFNTN